jgi:biotin transport system ATP-binding protein
VAELIGVRGLCHRFGDGVLGLSDISLSVDEGDFLLVAGRNGSGKSLLVKHFTGLCKPSSGLVCYRGKDIGKDIGRVRCALGMVFQDSDSQVIGQTIDEDVSFGPENLRLPRQEIEKRRDQALGRVSLSGMGQRRPDSLSGGERRRLAIAGTLAMEAECLILDEPFANLDRDGVCSVVRIISDLHRSGIALLVVTHELEKILGLADRLVVMDRGEIVLSGMPAPTLSAGVEAYGLRDPLRHPRSIEDLAWLD